MATAPNQSAQTDTQSQLVDLYRRALASGVPLDTINQKVSQQLARVSTSRSFEQKHTKERIKKAKRKVPLVVRVGALIIPVAFLGVGVYLVGSAVFPILLGFFSNKTWLAHSELAAPIPQEQVMDVTPLVITQVPQAHAQEKAQTTQYRGPEIIDEDLDYTNLSNWFSSSLPELADATASVEDKELTYILDIPKLNISNAVVTIGGTDLDESLIAYPGTAYPGDPGSPVIFGHSVLRQFYNPSEKNTRRYNSIFSTIMTLKQGDILYVTHQGVRYTYMVQEKKEVKPEDVYILTQHYDSRQLKLVTCTPEGTYLRRGVITASLIPTEEAPE